MAMAIRLALGPAMARCCLLSEACRRQKGALAPAVMAFEGDGHRRQFCDSEGHW